MCLCGGADNSHPAPTQLLNTTSSEERDVVETGLEFGSHALHG